MKPLKRKSEILIKKHFKNIKYPTEVETIFLCLKRNFRTLSNIENSTFYSQCPDTSTHVADRLTGHRCSWPGLCTYKSKTDNFGWAKSCPSILVATRHSRKVSWGSGDDRNAKVPACLAVAASAVATLICQPKSSVE